jgi:exodeoxyribonuclease-3
MKLASWNVNGLRAALKKGFWETVRGLGPDVLGLQETRAEEPPEVPLEFGEYRWYWNTGERKGYAGVAVLARVEPLAVKTGIGHDEFDEEGRAITLEYPHYYVVNAYFPNAGRGLPRLGFKLAFNQAIAEYLEGLRKKKGVVLMGDLNVAHREIDIARPKQNVKNAGFTPEERAWLDAFLSKGWIDTFRYLHPDETGAYTWWSYRFNARAKNIGWRLDYVIISEDLLPHLQDAYIYYDTQASDHVPAVAVLDV